MVRLVCHAVAGRMPEMAKACTTSAADLAADTGLSRGAVKRHLRRAAAAGLLIIEKASGGPGPRLRLVPRLPNAHEPAPHVDALDVTPATGGPAAPTSAPVPSVERDGISLLPGDPRWVAWLHHDRQQPGTSSYAASAYRNRWSYTASADWPPQSRDVEEVAGRFLIPWGTAEHAAWLAHWRREGRLGIERAQAADVGKRRLSEQSRWPPLPLPAPPPAAAIGADLDRYD